MKREHIWPQTHLACWTLKFARSLAAIGLVVSIGTVGGAVTDKRLVNALARLAAKLIRPTGRAAHLVGFVRDNPFGHHNAKMLVCNPCSYHYSQPRVPRRWNDLAHRRAEHHNSPYPPVASNASDKSKCHVYVCCHLQRLHKCGSILYDCASMCDSSAALHPASTRHGCL